MLTIKKKPLCLIIETRHSRHISFESDDVLRFPTDETTETFLRYLPREKN